MLFNPNLATIVKTKLKQNYESEINISLLQKTAKDSTDSENEEEVCESF